MATKKNENQELTVDEKPPKYLKLQITDSEGRDWGVMMAEAKVFKSEAVGFFTQGKLLNPESGKKYQVGCNIILAGSKPKES